jgi:hypothetical protein
VISPAIEPQHIDKTATSSVQENVVPIPQTMASVVRQVVELRDLADATQNEVAELHRRINVSDLERRTTFKVREGVAALLDVLADQYGMSWNHIAALAGVSPQSVLKWRKGEPATGPNRLKVARLGAFLDLLSEMGIVDPSQWLEVPIVPGYSVNAIDFYVADKIDLLLEWADMRIDKPERVLDLFDADWREKYGSNYETFSAADGKLSIRHRGE